MGTELELPGVPGACNVTYNGTVEGRQGTLAVVTISHPFPEVSTNPDLGSVVPDGTNAVFCGGDIELRIPWREVEATPGDDTMELDKDALAGVVVDAVKEAANQFQQNSDLGKNFDDAVKRRAENAPDIAPANPGGGGSS